MILIVYLHGFNSAPQSVKAELLVHAAASLPDPPRVHVPALPVSPRATIAAVQAWVDGHRHPGQRLCFVGSSLGGFHATWLAEHYGARAVVINPAVQPHASLQGFLGPQQNLYTGERYELTSAHLDEMRAFRVATLADPSRFLLMVRSGDELLDWREAVRYYAGAWQYVGGGGDHGWEDFAPMLPTVLQFAGCASAG